MQALTQCWFTRTHRPARVRHREADGSVTSTCRYCERAIVSWDRTAWSLADGFDVARLAETASGRFLTLYDTAADFVVHRYPVAHLNDEEAIAAFKLQLRAEHGLDDPHSALELRDSARRGGRAIRAPQAQTVAAGLPFAAESDQNLLS